MKTLYSLLFVGILAASAARAEVIKCLDKDGNIIFTDTSSPECVERVGEKKATPEPETQITSPGTDEELARRAREAQQAEQDRVLLLTYQSVAEIEAVRDSRVDQIESRNFLTEHYLQSLRQQLEDLEAAAANIRASGSEPGSPAQIPADLQEDIQSTRTSIEDYEQRLAAGQAEQEKIREKFAADIERFQELKGITAGH